MHSSSEVTVKSPPDIGSHDDVYNRLLQQLPAWFGTDHPNLDTVLEAFITTGVFHYSQIAYVKLQQRLQTATENNLDLISKDYLGNDLPRREGETDDSYRTRISATLLQEKATRRGLQNALYILTGYQPILFEPWRPLDTACCNVPQTNGCSTYGLCGSGSYPYQGFVDVFVSAYQGMANYGGCNVSVTPCNTLDPNAKNWCGGESLERTIISDQDICKTIKLTKVSGTVVWVRINRNAT